MIHLVTDSTAYLPDDIKWKYNVHQVSLKVIIEDQAYDEMGGITQAEFFNLLGRVETAPTTSQPAVGEFVQLYDQLTRNGDEVISLHISAGLSGTIPNAMSAAQAVAPHLISVVDSRTSAIGLLLMVIEAGEAIAAGQSRAQVLALLDRMIAQSTAVFMVENLAYLHKGGRINGATRLLGTLLNIKPILYMNEGKIEPLDKARSSARAKKRVLDEVVQRIGPAPARVAVAHIQAPQEAAELADQARLLLNCVSLHISEVGPVIGTHVGPGFLGIAACPVSSSPAH